MDAPDLIAFYLCVLASILVCRCVPLFALKGRELSPRVSEALGLIPPAAFAALVANDLFDPASGFSLPAGEYLALRILIGAGAGQNWWCVVFPPLCTAASADVPETALAAGLTEDQVSLMTEEDSGYVLKFKAVEWWEQLKAALS